MDMVNHLRRLFSYDLWANREFAIALRPNGAPPQALGRLGHILSAQKLWLERLQGEKQTLPVWPEFTLAEGERLCEEMGALWKDYLEDKSEADLAESISYKNSKGEPWQSKKEDVLLHVIMHSAYHRGQIATDLRAAGFAPAYTDFIHGVRQGLIE